MLAGNARITAVDNDGKNFIADVAAGDLWYFPAGIPHSIQGLGPDGYEFLLAFPDGSFSESSTFILSEVFARTPKEVLSANFGVPENAFDPIPKEQLFIFETPVPGQIETDAIASPQGVVPQSMILRKSDQKTDKGPGGTVRIVDTRNFPIATEVAAAIVEVAPKSMSCLERGDDGVRFAGFLPNLRLPRGRRRLRSEVNEALCSEHRR